MVLQLVNGNVSVRHQELKNLITRVVCRYLVAVRDNSAALTRILISHLQILSILFGIQI